MADAPGPSRDRGAPDRVPGDTDAEPRAEPGWPTLEGRLVLLVDDKPDVLRVLREIFDRVGAHAHAAGSGPEAVGLLTGLAGRLDLVVSDVKMPYASGVDVGLALLEHAPDVPVLFISGLQFNPGLAPPLTRLRSAFLPKPFAGDELLAASARLLSRGRHDR